MTDVRDDERNYDKSSVEVTFFKPSGKYYTDETIELPAELRGSIEISQDSDRDVATKLIYKRREWLHEAVKNRYVGMHRVCLDSDVIGFPMMIVRSDINRVALLNIADKLEGLGSGISFKREIAQGIRNAVDSYVEVQAVDVASLRELAELMKNGPNRTMFKADKDVIEKHFTYLLSTYADIIRTAIGDVPEHDSHYMMPDGITKRKLTSWLRELAELTGIEYDEAHVSRIIGKINNVVDEYKKTLVKIGCMLGYDDGELPLLPEVLLGELDKRLMPPGMEWPRWEDGNPLREDDVPDCLTVVSLYIDGSGYGLSDAILDHQTGERVKRPEPEALGADGLPIKVGEAVWFADGANATEFVVAEMSTDSEYSVRMRLPESPEQDGQWFLPQALTHTPPDTQERIDEDAWLDAKDYCRRYAVPHDAIVHAGKAKCDHLLRRQRELDARTTGGAR